MSAYTWPSWRNRKNSTFSTSTASSIRAASRESSKISRPCVHRPYDEGWQAAPDRRLPADFDYRFYQTAHPSLILPGYLRGDEAVRIEGCRPGGAVLAFTLPAVVPAADHAWDDGRAVRSRRALDGLHLDLRGDEPRVYLTWRGWVVRCPAYHGAVLAAVPLAQAAGLAVSGEHGLTEEADA